MSRHESHTPHDSQGLAGMLAKAFVDSKLTPLFILASVLLGAAVIRIAGAWCRDVSRNDSSAPF